METAGLLVGQEREDDIPRRGKAVPLEPPGDCEAHGQHVLHVDRAPTPHIAVLHGTGERVHGPLGGVRRHNVQVPMHQQPATRRVGAGQPSDDVAAPRMVPGFHVGDVVPDLTELARYELGGDTLPDKGLGVARVGGVDADQVTGQADDLVLGPLQPRVVISAGDILVVCAHQAFLSPGEQGGGCRWSGNDHGLIYSHNTAGPPDQKGGAEASEWRNGRRASLRC